MHAMHTSAKIEIKNTCFIVKNLNKTYLLLILKNLFIVILRYKTTHPESGYVEAPASTWLRGRRHWLQARASETEICQPLQEWSANACRGGLQTLAGVVCKRLQRWSANVCRGGLQMLASVCRRCLRILSGGLHRH
jgi:hypothetical protein